MPLRWNIPRSSKASPQGCEVDVFTEISIKQHHRQRQNRGMPAGLGATTVSPTMIPGSAVGWPVHRSGPGLATRMNRGVDLGPIQMAMFMENRLGTASDGTWLWFGHNLCGPSWDPIVTDDRSCLATSRENHRGWIGEGITWMVQKLMVDHKMDAIGKAHPNIPSVLCCDGDRIE